MYIARLILDVIFYALHVLIIWGFLQRDEFSYLVNPLLTGSTYLLIIFLEKRIRLRVTAFARICLMGTLLAHMVGEYYYIYEWKADFDLALHFFGTFSFTLVGYSLLRLLRLHSTRPWVATVVVVTLLGISLGTLLELGEFALDVLFESNNQRGLFDTNLDLVFDLIGAVLAALYLARTDPLA